MSAPLLPYPETRTDMTTQTDLLIEAGRLDIALIDVALAQAEQRARHDCRDRRRTKMDGAIEALKGVAEDLTEFAGNEGIAYLSADKLRRLAYELEGFKARDLLSMRKLQS